MAGKCDHEKLMRAGIHELRRVSDEIQKLARDAGTLPAQFQTLKKGTENDRDQLDKRLTRMRRNFGKEISKARALETKTDKRISKLERALRERSWAASGSTIDGPDMLHGKENSASTAQAEAIDNTVATTRQKLKDLQERVAATEASISRPIHSRFQDLEARMDAIIESMINERLRQRTQEQHKSNYIVLGINGDEGSEDK